MRVLSLSRRLALSSRRLSLKAANPEQPVEAAPEWTLSSATAAMFTRVPDASDSKDEAGGGAPPSSASTSRDLVGTAAWHAWHLLAALVTPAAAYGVVLWGQNHERAHLEAVWREQLAVENARLAQLAAAQAAHEQQLEERLASRESAAVRELAARVERLEQRMGGSKQQTQQEQQQRQQAG